MKTLAMSILVLFAFVPNRKEVQGSHLSACIVVVCVHVSRGGGYVYIVQFRVLRNVSSFFSSYKLKYQELLFARTIKRFPWSESQVPFLVVCLLEKVFLLLEEELHPVWFKEAKLA